MRSFIQQAHFCGNPGGEGGSAVDAVNGYKVIDVEALATHDCPCGCSFGVLYAAP